MPGPPPKPTELVRALGNPGKRALPAERDVVALRPADGIPDAPDHFGERASAVWVRVWTAARAWLSPDTDLELLIRYCDAQDARDELREVVGREGLTTIGSQGQKVINPLINQLNNVEKQLTKYEQLLGFTPVDRSRLGLAEVKKVNALEDFFARRGAGDNRPN